MRDQQHRKPLSDPMIDQDTQDWLKAREQVYLEFDWTPNESGVAVPGYVLHVADHAILIRDVRVLERIAEVIDAALTRLEGQDSR